MVFKRRRTVIASECNGDFCCLAVAVLFVCWLHWYWKLPDHAKALQQAEKLVVSTETRPATWPESVTAIVFNPSLSSWSANERSDVRERIAIEAGRFKLVGQRPEQAVRWFRRATELTPREVLGWHNLAVALHQFGDFLTAINTASRAIELAEGEQVAVAVAQRGLSYAAISD